MKEGREEKKRNKRMRDKEIKERGREMWGERRREEKGNKQTTHINKKIMFTDLSAWAVYDTRSIFQRSLQV